MTDTEGIAQLKAEFPTVWKIAMLGATSEAEGLQRILVFTSYLRVITAILKNKETPPAVS